MIEDKEVDLTIGHKFYTPDWQKNKRSNYAKDRIITGKYSANKRVFFDIDPLIGERICRLAELPWNRKASKVNSLNDKNKRRYSKLDDTTSREFGGTIRSTSSNTIMFLDGSGRRNPAVVEEVFLETIGYIPFTALSRCYRCGNQIFAPHNSIAFWCNKCESESHLRLPWQRTHGLVNNRI